jgi:amidase
VTDLCFTPARELVELYRRGEATPLDAVEAMLARIDAVNPELNAYVTVAREQALEAATALAGHAVTGPLHGVPVGIKDLTETAGIRTTFASTIYADHVPEADELIVARLKAAGAIVLGKTNTPEFGAGGNTFNDIFGVTRNPWDPALTCGGSSGGSAVALATGMSPLCEGSDLGGSLRTPAAFCNVVGFRTTPGLVPIWPDGAPFEGLAVTGPMARDVADCALMLSVVAGWDERVPLSYEVDAAAFAAAAAPRRLDGVRVAFTPDLGGLLPVDPEVAGTVTAAMAVFEGLGARVTHGSPDFAGVREAVLASRGIGMVASHEDHLRDHRERMQSGLVWNIEQGLSLTPPEIAAGVRARGALWARVAEFMGEHDFLVCPTVAVPPFPVEQPYPTEIGGVPLADYTQWFFLTYAITLTGLPAISVPCGFTGAGLPVGMQIVGRRRREVDVLAAAASYEAETGWHLRRPPVTSR